MKKNRKRVLSGLLAAVMLCSSFPASALGGELLVGGDAFTESGTWEDEWFAEESDNVVLADAAANEGAAGELLFSDDTAEEIWFEGEDSADADLTAAAEEEAAEESQLIFDETEIMFAAEDTAAELSEAEEAGETEAAEEILLAAEEKTLDGEEALLYMVTGEEEEVSEGISYIIVPEGVTAYRKFVPAVSGDYNIFSYGTEDTYGYLYDSEGQEIASNDDNGIANNFLISYALTEGETYYIAVRYYDGSVSGEIELHIEQMPVSSIEFIPAEPWRYIEHTHGNEDFRWDSTLEKEISYWRYYTPDYKNGDRLIVNGSNGDVVTFTYDADMYDWVSDNPASSIGTYQGNLNVWFVQNQEEEPFTAGNDYEVKFSYAERECSVWLSIVEDPVTAVTYTPAEPIVYEQEKEDPSFCWWSTDNDGNRYFYYGYSYHLGDQVTLTTNEGDLVYTYQYDEEEWNSWFFDENGKRLDSSDINIISSQETEHWIQPGEYHYTFVFRGKTADIPATITESPISGITYQRARPVKILENDPSKGYMANDGMFEKDYYYYYADQCIHGDVMAEGDTLTVLMSDGSQVVYTYSYDEEDESWYFLPQGTVPDDLPQMFSWWDLSFSDNQGNEYWLPGKENFLKVMLTPLGRSAQIPVTIVKNDITAIAWEPAERPALREGVDGYDDNYYDSEKDENIPYFRYNYAQKLPGDRLTVTHEDGTQDIYEYTDRYVFVNTADPLDAIYTDDVQAYDRQGQTPWSVDQPSDNVVYISYGGKETRWYVLIEGNPVESIVYTPVKDWQMIENTCGDTDQKNGGGEYFNYHYWDPYNRGSGDSMLVTGDQLTLNYTDGTSETFVCESGFFYSQTGAWNGDDQLYASFNSAGDHWRSSSTGNVLEADVIFIDTQRAHPWTKGGENYVTVQYMGREMQLPVAIIDDPVTEIELVLQQELTWVRETHGYEREAEDGSTWYYYNEPGWGNGDQVILHMSDGSSVIYTAGSDEAHDWKWGLWSDSGEELETDDIRWTSDQEEGNPWEVGEHTFRFYVRSIYTEIPVTITENPVASIDYVPAEPWSYVENTHGYENSRWNEYDEEVSYWHYYSPSTENGDQLIVTGADGNVVTFTLEDWEWVSDNPASPIGTFAGNLEIWIVQEQSQNPLATGGTYDVTVRYQDRECTLPLTIVENPVASIEYIPAGGAWQWVEKTHGKSSWTWNEETGEEEEYWEYDVPGNENGDRLIVHGSDGSTVTFTWDDNGGWQSDNPASELGEIHFSLEIYQTNEHYTVGNSYPVRIEYYGRTCTAPLEIVQDPIESIEYVSAEPIVLTENTNGEWTEDDGDRYYVYYVSLVRNGDQMIVHYNDGSQSIWTFDGDSDCFENQETNERIYDWNVNSRQPWLAGENEAQFCWHGLTASIPVTIVESPVKSISYTRANPISLREHGYGDWDVDDEGEDFFYYYGWMPEESKSSVGDVLTVTMKDGTQIVYTYAFDRTKSGYAFYTDQDVGQTQIGFYSEDGVSFRDNQYRKHWLRGSDNAITVSYYGCETQIPVIIEENTVSEIEFVPGTREPLYENITGELDFYWDDELDTELTYFRYSYSSMRRGDRLVISFTDQDAKTYEYRSDYFVNVKDNEDRISYEEVQFIDHQREVHWRLGSAPENVVTVTYAGKSFDWIQTILPNPVEKIEYIPAEPLTVYEHLDGEFDSEGRYHYYLENRKTIQDGDRLLVTTAEGVKTYVQMDWGFRNVDDDSDRIWIGSEEDHVNWSDNQESVEWQVGREGYITFRYMKKTAQVPVTVLPNPVKAIRFVPASALLSIVEDTQGFWDTDEDGENYWFYQYRLQPGDQLILTLENGTEEVYTAPAEVNRWESLQFQLRDQDGTRTLYNHYPYELLIEDDSQWEHHWTIGRGQSFSVSFMGREAAVPVEIVENPIDHIAFTPAQEYVLYEGINGDYTSSGASEEDMYFRYDLPYLQGGDTLTLWMKDQTKKTYRMNEKQQKLISAEDPADTIFLSDVDMESLEDQDEVHWTPGDQEIVVRYLNKTVSVPVKVLPNPVESIEYQSALTSFVENTRGWEEEADPYGIYWHYQWNFQIGDALIVHRKDGTTVKYVFQSGAEYGAFVNTMDLADVIVDWRVRASYNSADWRVGKNNQLKVTYAGRETFVPIEIVSNPVAAVAYTPKTPFSFLENSNGYWEFDEYDEEFFSYNTEFVKGDELTVSLKDGTFRTYIYQYSEKDERDAFINQADPADVIHYLDINFIYSQYEHGNHWTLGRDNALTVRYLGVESAPVPVEIRPNLVASISLEPGEVTYVEEVNGDWETIVGEHYFHYNTGFKEGNRLTVTDTSGNSRVYQYEYVQELGEAFFVNVSDSTDRISTWNPHGDYVSYDDRQWDLYGNNGKRGWQAGGTYKIIVAYAGKSAEVKASVVANDVASIAYQTTGREYMENGERSFEATDEQGKPFTAYNAWFDNGDKLTVTKTNGTILTYTYGYSDKIGKAGFINDADPTDILTSEDETFGVSMDGGRQDQKHWTVGNTYDVTVNYMGKTATFKVSIVPAVVAVTGVSLNVTDQDVAVTKTLQLAATVKPANATNQKVTWKSADPAIASVDANGKVTGRKVGKTTITATTEDGNKTAKMTVHVLFDDASRGVYYTSPVYWAGEMGITNGMADADDGVKDGMSRIFGTGLTCTRGQIVTFLWRSFGKPEPSANAIKNNKFKDIKKSDYYYKAVLWAVEKGITNGYADDNYTTFRPNAECLREHAVTFLWRAAGKPEPSSKTVSSNRFKDIKKTDYYYKAVLWAVEKGITNGYADDNYTTFRPKASCLREQIVTFLWRYKGKPAAAML